MALEIELDEDTAANEAIDAAKAKGEAEYSEPETELPPDMEEPAPKAKAKVASKKPVDRARVAPKKKVEANPLAEPDDAYEGPVKEAAMKAEKATADALGKRIKSNVNPNSPMVNPLNKKSKETLEAGIKESGKDYIEAAVGGRAVKAISPIANKALNYLLDTKERNADNKAAIEKQKAANQKENDRISNNEGEALVAKGDIPYAATAIKPNPARKAAMAVTPKKDKYIPTENVPNKPASVYNKPLLASQKSKQLKIAENANRSSVIIKRRVPEQKDMDTGPLDVAMQAAKNAPKAKLNMKKEYVPPSNIDSSMAARNAARVAKKDK
jgi:hypothetical protein